MVPIMLVLWSVFQTTSGKHSKMKGYYELNSKIDVAGSIIAGLILLIVLWNLYASVETYNPSQFTISDVDYLFPSPISPRTIYVFTMFRSSFMIIFRVIFTGVIYLYIGSNTLSASGSIFIAIIAFYLISIFLQSASCLVYFLCIKYNIGNGIKYFIKGFIVVIAAYIAFKTFTSNNLVQGFLKALNGKVIQSIPVIGWTKVIVLYPYAGGSLPSFQIIALLITTITVLGFTVLMADDYYEEAFKGAEHIHKRKQAAKERKGGIDSVNTEKYKKKKNTRISIDVKGEFKGPWAFLWKEILIRKMIGKYVFINGFKIFWLLIFLVISYLIRKNNVDSIMGMYAFVFIGIMIFIPTGVSPLMLERRSSYLYLLPGKARDKILAIHSISFINTIIYCGIITFPILAFGVNMKFIQRIF